MIISFPEEVIEATSLIPAADAGGRTGTFVSLKNALMAFVRVHIGQGNAATVLISVNQATDVAGTAAKAIPVVPVWANQDEAASSVQVRQTDALSFTTSAAVKDKIVYFQIDPAKLDTANGFDCINAITGASNAANITEATILIVPRYPQAAQINAKVD